MEILWRTAMSIDGRLATADASLDFLGTIAAEGEALAEFPAFVASVDAILLGADTLRWLVRGGHGWPHGDKPTWLISHDEALAAQLGPLEHPLRRRAGALAPVLAELEASGARRVWLCGGGAIANQVLALDRLDEIEVVIAPAVLGAGPNLFGDQPLAARAFTLVECARFAGTAVKLRWRRDRAAG